MAQVKESHRGAIALLVKRERTDGDDLVGTVVRVHEKLTASLASVVGAQGVRILFARSMVIAGKEHPALLAAASGEDDGARMLRACLEKLPASAVLPAAGTLYATFFALLTSFIGGELTARILQNAWPGVAITFEDDS
jgi:hypothetical protein